MATTSTLRIAAGSTDTVLQLQDTANFPVNGGIVKIDSESILYTTATDRTLIGCTRAYAGSSAASHLVAATVTLTEGPNLIPVGSMNISPAVVSSTDDSLTKESVLWIANDPTAVPTFDALDQNTVWYVSMDGSATNQSWTLPNPSQLGVVHRLNIVFNRTAGTNTLSVNSVTITPGAGQLFMWVPSSSAGTSGAWYAC